MCTDVFSTSSRYDGYSWAWISHKELILQFKPHYLADKVNDVRSFVKELHFKFANKGVTKVVSANTLPCDSSYIVIPINYHQGGCEIICFIKPYPIGSNFVANVLKDYCCPLVIQCILQYYTPLLSQKMDMKCFTV